MKVEEGKAFVPITITLETEAEARAMFHLLNRSWNPLRTAADYFAGEGYKTTQDEIERFQNELYDEFKPYIPANI